MDATFNDLSYQCSRNVTSAYSTSFSLAVKMLRPNIRNPIHAIYGFVRFADEIVDSFHTINQEKVLDDFEIRLYEALDMKFSMNPILNSFQKTVNQYSIDRSLIEAFLKSMRADLYKKDYEKVSDYQDYIYGSADVVGLMCLKVFVDGNQEMYESLKPAAMKLGSAFQKVNFLRDLKADSEDLERSYFPQLQSGQLNASNKQAIIDEIEADFEEAYHGIVRLPMEARFGVYTAYIYYRSLLRKLKRVRAEEIKETRIRISNPAKMRLLVTSFVSHKLNLL